MFETRRFEKAIRFYESALNLDKLSGFREGIADDLDAIGSVYFNMEKNKPAVNFFNRSVKIYALIGNKHKVNHIMPKLVKASEKSGINISVTKYFINKWLKEKIFQDHCCN